MTAAEPPTALEKPDAYSLAMNGVPLLLLLAGGLSTSWLLDGVAARATGLVAWIYLAPPLIGRALLLAFGRPEGTLDQSMRAYRVWWALFQLQIVFNRLPWLEELLRLVPGLYAAWIRLWGGHVSAFAYIGPGTLITDRYLVRVEPGAVLGMKAALAGHMVLRDAAGRWQIVVAAPVVEREAIVGGDAGLGPGAVLRSGALLPAGRRIGPFEQWPRQPRGAADGR